MRLLIVVHSSDEMRGLLCAEVMTVVDVLDHGFAVVELVGVRHVVEEKQQVVGCGGGGLVHLRHFGRILTHEAGSRRDGAVHADAQVVGAMPLAPAIAAHLTRCSVRNGCR